MGREEKLQEIERLRFKIHQLEAELEHEQPKKHWVTEDYYTTYHILAGLMLGFLGGAASLLFNVVGSVLVGQHPMELIRVFMTFPLGERALQIDSGAVLAMGSCLYLGTGMMYGMIFHLILSRFFSKTNAVARFLISSGMGLVLWLVNFYGVLSWLQPMAFGGDWIVRLVPIWVAILTHLVFAWTMLFVDEWGYFDREGHLKQH